MRKLQLLEDLSSRLAFSRKVSNQKGENFNLISLLNMERDEMRTHSRIIGELLNSEGTHGQGNTFLKLFLKGFDDIDFNIDEYHLYLEYHIGKIDNGAGGRIDIFLQDNQGKVIIIENKIDAGETNGQLKRYRKVYSNAIIFYLTLFSEEIDEELKCIDITYEHHIVNWLEECRKESIDLPVLREALAQYLYLIKKITHQTQQMVMETEIKNRILRDNQSLEDFLELCDFKKEIIATIHEEFFDELVKELSVRFGLELIDEIEDITNENKKYFSFNFSSQTLELLDINIEFQFGMTDKRYFYYGLSFNDDVDNKEDIYEKIRSRIKIEDTRFSDFSNEYWLYWFDSECLSNWKDDKELLNMKNGTGLKEIINKVEFMLGLLKSS